MSAPTLTANTANVVRSGGGKRKKSATKKPPRPSRAPLGVSDPDPSQILVRADLTAFLGADVQVTVCVAGVRSHYRGRLAELLAGDAPGGRSGGVRLTRAWNTDRREVGEVIVARRWLTNCVAVGE